VLNLLLASSHKNGSSSQFTSVAYVVLVLALAILSRRSISSLSLKDILSVTKTTTVSRFKKEASCFLFVVAVPGPKNSGHEGKILDSSYWTTTRLFARSEEEIASFPESQFSSLICMIEFFLFLKTIISIIYVFASINLSLAIQDLMHLDQQFPLYSLQQSAKRNI
jgi:hypothetical protein